MVLHVVHLSHEPQIVRIVVGWIQLQSALRMQSTVGPLPVGNILDRWRFCLYFFFARLLQQINEETFSDWLTML
jgi:hypothetical protein